MTFLGKVKYWGDMKMKISYILLHLVQIKYLGYLYFRCSAYWTLREWLLNINQYNLFLLTEQVNYTHQIMQSYLYFALLISKWFIVLHGYLVFV